MPQQLSQVEIQLLENLFDSLDRLLDRQCLVIEVYAIVFATEHALKPYSTPLSLTSYSENLLQVVRSGKNYELQRTSALEVTDDLRHKLDDLLPL